MYVIVPITRPCSVSPSTGGNGVATDFGVKTTGSPSDGGSSIRSGSVESSVFCVTFRSRSASGAV